MKSFNHLFGHMIWRKNVIDCIFAAAKHKNRRQDVQEYLANLDWTADYIIEQVKSGKWKPPKHHRIKVIDKGSGKTREITKPRWRDEQIIHHLLMSQFRPIVLPRIDRHIYGCIPGRGPHEAMERMVHWVRGYGKKKFYVAELDVKKFYDHIDHYILKELLSRLIRDTRYLDLLFKVIDGYRANPDAIAEGAKGLPLGNYTSPWLANFYLIGMDNFILQELKPDHYLRYMDNLFIFDRNKRKLHRKVRRLKRWLQMERSLEIKKNWQVFRFEDYHNPKRGRAINALGFVIHRHHVSLRKSILRGIRRAANKIYKKGIIHEKDAASFVSRYGYGMYCDIHAYLQKHIKKKVSPASCRDVIAGKNRRRRKKNQEVAELAILQEMLLPQ